MDRFQKAGGVRFCVFIFLFLFLHAHQAPNNLYMLSGFVRSFRSPIYAVHYRLQSYVMLAKGNRSRKVTKACKSNGGFYLGSIGGPAAILAENCIKKVEVQGTQKKEKKDKVSSLLNAKVDVMR